MKKFNLFNEIIVSSKSEILTGINTGKVFGVNIKGEVCYEPFSDKEILIFKGKHENKPVSALTPPVKPTIESLLGKNYQIVEDDERVLIKAFGNWQELISINTPQSSYDDTTADGVAEFATKDMEDIGWHATEFDITYRELVEVLEEKCDGVILCIEQEEPYQFSGLGFLYNDDEAKDVIYEFCQTIIKDKIANDKDFEISNLSDDEALAASYFLALD